MKIDLKELKELLKNDGVLKPRELRVVQMRLAGKTLREIGQAEPNQLSGKENYVGRDADGVCTFVVCGSTLSANRINQILDKAIRKLRGHTPK